MKEISFGNEEWYCGFENQGSSQNYEMYPQFPTMSCICKNLATRSVQMSSADVAGCRYDVLLDPNYPLPPQTFDQETTHSTLYGVRHEIPGTLSHKSPLALKSVLQTDDNFALDQVWNSTQCILPSMHCR
jgi:hypothetical protein